MHNISLKVSNIKTFVKDKTQFPGYLLSSNKGSLAVHFV